MRYCRSCHHITPKEPLFCNFCGSSYDLKLCPARHPNPRTATVCSSCGSRELSTTQPPTSLAAQLLRVLAAVLLLTFTLFVLVEVIQALVQDPTLPRQFVWLVLFLGFVWWVYLQLPAFVRHGVRRLIRRRKGGPTNHEQH